MAKFKRMNDAATKRAAAALLLIASLYRLTLVEAQTVSASRNGLVQVTPQCRDDMIIVHVRFNPQLRAQFADWIIVGENARPECRLRGNGELRYVVQIVLRNDPCQTKQVEPNVFENTLRIAQFPSIILQDDLNFRFRCSRNTPEVVEFRLPQVNPTFDIDRNGFAGATRDLLPTLRTLGNTPRTPINGLIGGGTRMPTGLGDRSIGAGGFGSDFGAGGTGPNGLDMTRLAAGAAGGTGRPLADHSGVNNTIAVLLSALLILSVLVFLLCLFACLRYCQRRRDADAAYAKSTGAEISAPGVAGGGRRGKQQLLPAGYERRGRGAGQHSSATASPLSQNESHSPGSSSFSAGGEARRPADEDEDRGPWWVGKGGPQSYLLADGAPSPPDNNNNNKTLSKTGTTSRQQQQRHNNNNNNYIVRAVDVPEEQQQQFRQQQEQMRQAQQQQYHRDHRDYQDPEKAAASQAFRDALHFAHARSTELMRAPNSYAEWREKTLRRGRGSNGADLLLESEEADSSSHNHSDEGPGHAGPAAAGGSQPKTPPTLRLPDRRPAPGSGPVGPVSPSLPPSIHTPLRSITEVYHAAETRRPAGSTGPAGTRPARTRRGEFEDRQVDLILNSSDEGEYSIPRVNPSAKDLVGQGPARKTPPAELPRLSAEARERLIHCADSIRGFGPRKLTEQEIARWRQLIRGDVQLQTLIAEAHSLEELKTLCEMPDYRLHFTRIKWSQIMECVAGLGPLDAALVGPEARRPVGAGEKPPPPSYAAATLSRAQRPPAGEPKPGPVSQLNLKLNLFKSFGLPSSPSTSMASASARAIDADRRVHPAEAEAPVTPAQYQHKEYIRPGKAADPSSYKRPGASEGPAGGAGGGPARRGSSSTLHVYVGGSDSGVARQEESQAPRSRW